MTRKTDEGGDLHSDRKSFTFSEVEKVIGKQIKVNYERFGEEKTMHKERTFFLKN